MADWKDKLRGIAKGERMQSDMGDMETWMRDVVRLALDEVRDEMRGYCAGANRSREKEGSSESLVIQFSVNSPSVKYTIEASVLAGVVKRRRVCRCGSGQDREKAIGGDWTREKIIDDITEELERVQRWSGR